MIEQIERVLKGLDVDERTVKRFLKNAKVDGAEAFYESRKWKIRIELKYP